MRTFIAFTFLVVSLLVCDAQVSFTPISHYPNTAQPPVAYLIVLAQPGVTNWNMTLAQFMRYISTNTSFTLSFATNALPVNNITVNTTNLSLPNGKSFLISNTNVFVTATAGNSVLTVSNSGSLAITLNMLVGHAGINSTNALLIATGKEGIVSYDSNGAGSTNYVTTTFQ